MNLLDVSFDVNKAIDKLGQILGKYGPTVWDAVVRQVYVQAFTDLIWGLVFIIGGIAGYKFGRYLLKTGQARVNDHLEKKAKASTYEYVSVWDEGAVLAVGTGWLLSVGAPVVAAIVVASNLTEAIQFLLNPTWAALQMLRP